MIGRIRNRYIAADTVTRKVNQRDAGLKTAISMRGGKQLTKAELSKLYWLNKEIAEDKRKLDELTTAATTGIAKITGLPHVSGISRKVEDYGILIAEQRELIDLKIKQSMIEYKRLNDYISSVNDPQMRMILSLRYVNGLNWIQIAFAIGGGNTEDGVRMAINRFLRKM